MQGQGSRKEYYIFDSILSDKYAYPNLWSVTAKSENNKDCHKLWRDVCNLVADNQLLGEVSVGQPNFKRELHVSVEATKAGIDKLKLSAPDLQICSAELLQPHKPRRSRGLTP